MSGYKRATVTIPEEEYRRLHQAEMKRRFKDRARTKVKDQDHTAEFDNALRQMEDRQRRLEQALTELGSGMDEIQAEALQDMLRQNALHDERMMALLEESTRETDESIAAASRHFSEVLQQEREQYHEGLQSLMQRLDGYEQRETTRVEVARQWLRQSSVLADFIENQFDHERFMPGCLSRALASLDFAENNLTQGFLESSLQTSQQAFLELADLRAELEQRVMEWHAKYEKAQCALDGLINDLELNSCVSAIGLEGEELAESVDVEYWSNGKYYEMLADCRKRRAYLERHQQHLSVEELTKVYSERVPDLMQRFENIIYEARLNALNSQLRMNIAERALQALETHGFVLNESGYSDDDMRAQFTAQLGGCDGSQVTIQVFPSNEKSSELTNELVVITNHPEIKTEHEARLQWEELSRSLHDYNLEVSRPSVGHAPPRSQAEPEDTPVVETKQLASPKKPHYVR